MDIINVFRKIESYIQIKNRNIFSMTASEQCDYINSLPSPKDEIERSYYQYLCQKKLGDETTGTFIKFVAFLPYTLLKSKYCYSKKPVLKERVNAVFLPDGKADDIIPNSLREEFGGWNVEGEKKYFLSSDDINFINEVAARYPDDGMFLLKIMTKVARYRYLIDSYNPKALIVCNEYSFTSSIMKVFCNRNDVELINVMHGEKLYAMSDSFFSFNRCYVWDDYYIKLFTELRADNSQFRVEIPNSMRLSGYENTVKTIDYTYYLTDENEEQLNKIVEIVTCLINHGSTVAVRSHPRYTDVKKMKVGLPVNAIIESPREISIQKSLARTKNAISFVSTVLNQANANNINIIIDDVIRPNEFKKLKEQKYIMLNVEHKLLSELVMKMGD